MNPFYGVKLLAAARHSLQKERDDYRRMWIEALSQADRAEVDAKQARDRLVTEMDRRIDELRKRKAAYKAAYEDTAEAYGRLVAELQAIAADMDRWGVPASVRAVDPICADIHAWKGRLRAITTAPVEATITRCTSCDHTIDMHQSDGCWYTVETGVGNLVCVCSVSAQEQ